MMKSAYELAMERLNSEDPEAANPLTDQQREQLADISSRYKAKMAEREIFLRKQLMDAEHKGDPLEAEQIRMQLVREKERLHEEMEEKKEKIRQENT